MPNGGRRHCLGPAHRRRQTVPHDLQRMSRGGHERVHHSLLCLWRHVGRPHGQDHLVHRKAGSTYQCARHGREPCLTEDFVKPTNEEEGGAVVRLSLPLLASTLVKDATPPPTGSIGSKTIQNLTNEMKC